MTEVAKATNDRSRRALRWADLPEAERRVDHVEPQDLCENIVTAASH
jgi:hypothetical protein